MQYRRLATTISNASRTRQLHNTIDRRWCGIGMEVATGTSSLCSRQDFHVSFNKKPFHATCYALHPDRWFAELAPLILNGECLRGREG